MHKIIAAILLAVSGTTIAQTGVRMSTAGRGWAANSVNAVIFRHNSLTSFNNTQYIAYYDSAQQLVIGKRTIGSTQWTLMPAAFRKTASSSILLL